jgi:endonuclease/exonuclease/phosphatase family metal-dependent hydrolase
MMKPRALILAPIVLLLITASGCFAAGPRSQVWIGTAPFCSAEERVCDVLGLAYIGSDKAGDGLPCFSGAKVLCAAPQILQKPAEPDHLTRFTVVQYNIMDRPFWVGHEGQRERVCRIPQALARHIAAQEYVDVLVFNESFSGVCAQDLRLTDLLTLYGWPHHLPTISTWWRPGNGGIFIASKWPIVTSQDMVYTACRLPDCLAAKGVQYARIEKMLDGRMKPYHVFATHMQAWGGAEAAAVRNEQAHEMASFIDRQDIPLSQPVLLAGDFNTRGLGNPQFQAFADALRVSMPPIVGERRATMDVDNTLFGRGPWWVDYVLPSVMHQRPIKGELEALALRAETEFTLCVAAGFWPFYVSPYAAACTQTRRVRDLSDHYPVIGRFEYTE